MCLMEIDHSINNNIKNLGEQGYHKSSTVTWVYGDHSINNNIKSLGEQGYHKSSMVTCV